MLLDAKLSIYSNVRDRIGRTATFADFLQACIDSRPAVEALRATADQDERRCLKMALPCAAISGEFSPTRRTENLVQHSKLICADFDNLSNCAGLMARLATLDCCAFASRSCSGGGVFAVIPIAFPDRHREQFWALRRFFADWGYELDAQCSDVTRLRVVSFDPEAVLRTDAVPFRGLWREPRQTYQFNPRQRFDEDATLSRVQSCVEQIISRSLDVTETYEDWMRAAFALGSLGESGREFFHAVSSQSQKYDSTRCDKKFSECVNARSIGSGTFFEICRQHGVTYKN